jgi:hypothetical protein
MPLKNIRLIKLSLINFINRIIFSVKIEGESAWPDLVPGKFYLATNLLKAKIGDFVVFKEPRNQEVFAKRIKEIKEGDYFLEGNLPWAESSKDFGLINKKLILGKIIK